MSLFGNTTTPSFSFGSTPSTAAASAPPTSAPSLFGAPSATTSTAGGGGSLFGTTPASAPAPALGGSLFSGLGQAAPPAKPPTFSFGGQATTAATPGQSSQPGTSSLFGGAPSTGGLFGGATSSTTGATTSGGLFGSQNLQQPQPGGGGLFGTTQPGQPNQPQFGQSTTTTMTASAAAPATGISKQTKFQDLPDQARNLVEEMDKYIRSQGQLADDLKGKNLGSEITQTRRMYDQYSAEATTVTSLLENDSRLIASLRHDLEQSLSDLSKTTTLIEGFKAGSNSAKAGEAKAVAAFPYEFFRRKSTELEGRVTKYRQTIDQISAVLMSPQSSLSPSSILPTLKAQHASLMSLAHSVSSLDSELERLKAEYRDIWREKTGRLVDPFRLASSSSGQGGGVRGVENGMRGIEIR